MTFLIAEFMFLSTRWYKDLSDSSYGGGGGEMVQYEHDLN